MLNPSWYVGLKGTRQASKGDCALITGCLRAAPTGKISHPALLIGARHCGGAEPPVRANRDNRCWCGGKQG